MTRSSETTKITDCLLVGDRVLAEAHPCRSSTLWSKIGSECPSLKITYVLHTCTNRTTEVKYTCRYICLQKSILLHSPTVYWMDYIEQCFGNAYHSCMVLNEKCTMCLGKWTSSGSLRIAENWDVSVSSSCMYIHSYYILHHHRPLTVLPMSFHPILGARQSAYLSKQPLNNQLSPIFVLRASSCPSISCLLPSKGNAGNREWNHPSFLDCLGRVLQRFERVW